MLEVPKIGDPSLVYMYGLSDFWTEIFKDKDIVEAVLASSTITLAETYSYFLQRAAGISLADIEARYKNRIRLIILDETEDNLTFPLDPSIRGFSKIVNKPLLPTMVIEEDVHYEVIDGNITFFKPIDQLRFPARSKDGGGNQYAFWLVDAVIDEDWIDNSFGRLVGFTEENTVFNYKSFLEGIYYLYGNGSNVEFIERGVTLAMGMPYARATEPVLDIVQDSDTGNWHIFTDAFGYEIPYGHRPDLSIGSMLTENTVISSWVRVVDYKRDGAWWYGIFLPQEVLGRGTTPEDIGLCTEGSIGDQMMQSFLKHHMFNVQIQQPTGDQVAFDTVKQLVMRSKPEYTFPIFVWSVPVEDELLLIEDEGLTYGLSSYINDTIISAPSIEEFYRGNEDMPFSRGKHWYNRYQISEHLSDRLGYQGMGGWSPEFYEPEPHVTRAIVDMTRGRGEFAKPMSRGTPSRGLRGHGTTSYAQDNSNVKWIIPSTKVHPNTRRTYEIFERDLVPLYMIHEGFIIERIREISKAFVLKADDYIFLLPELEKLGSWLRRGDEGYSDYGKYTFGISSTGLSPILSLYSSQTYLPPEDNGGTIMVTRSIGEIWAAYLVVREPEERPTGFPVMNADTIEITERYAVGVLGENTPINRSMVSVNSAPFLASRGRAGGEYEGIIMNRSGVPRDKITGEPVEHLDIVRRTV